MEMFNKEASMVVDMMEDVAGRLFDDEKVKEYFIAHYGCADCDDAAYMVLKYIEDKFFG